MKKHKNILQFLVKFFLTYGLLFIIYAFYLQKTQQKKDFFTCSPLTTTVAEQTVFVLNIFGFNADFFQHDKELSIKLLIDNVYISRVIEGCNSVSIIILFIAFVIAFKGKFKTTILYVLFGSLLIYIINILRIAFLTIMLYKHPNQEELLHNLIFPAIIYGTVFFLWVIWVQKFSDYKK